METGIKQCFLVLFALLLVAVSCSTKPFAKQLVLTFLRENTNGTEYSIIEISGPDSLYSPGERITSLMIKKSRSLADLSKQLNEAFDKPTLKERKAAAEEVAKLAFEEYNDIEGIDIIVHSLTDKSFDESPANRIAYRVKYKVDGDLKEDVFYLERDNSAVGQTASEMLERYFELCEMNGKLFELKTDAEQVARDMK